MNELTHHGIKGQKWGVRHGPPYPLKREYHQQKGDVILKKGQTFQRITTGANSGITKGVYTSYRNKDKDLYKGVLGRMRIQYQHKTGEKVQLKEHKMTAKEDIRLPSRKVRLDTFKRLYGEDPEGFDRLIQEHEKSRYKKDYKRPNLNNEKGLEEAYRKFNDALAMGQQAENKRIITRYYYSLKQQGYNAIPDENDIRLSSFKAQAPIIVFNTKASIGDVTVRDLTASEVFSAYTRSIGPKTVRNVLERKGMGQEKLTAESEKKASKYVAQLRQDKARLNENYTLDNLAEDWAKGMSRSSIERISKKMDTGMTHEEALASQIGLGNMTVAYLMGKLNL